MTAREHVHRKLIRLQQQSRKTGQIRLPAAGVAAVLETAVHFLLAAVLAGSGVSGGCTPFGVAFVGAAGSGLRGGGALLGACFGYLTTLDFSPGLRHVSAAMLTFAVAFAFYDIKLFRAPWIMPLLTGMVHSFTGAILLSQTGWNNRDALLFLLEFILTVLGVFCYREALRSLFAPRENRLFPSGQRAGLLFLLATSMMALVPIGAGQLFSLGCCLGQLVVLSVAWQGGITAGTVFGIALGAAADLAAGTTQSAIAFSLAGLLTGFSKGKTRYRAAGSWMTVMTTLALWSEYRGEAPAFFFAALAAAPLFLMIPQRFLRQLGPWLSPQLTGPNDWNGQDIVRRRLEASAKAFRVLGESLRTSFRPPRNDNDISQVFDRAAGQVCRSCTLRDHCWKQEYTTTFNALNDATAPMLERGRAERGDFPSHFSSRCLHFPNFLSAVNGELTALLYRRQFNARLGENRAAVCRQYSQLSDLLTSAAAELSRELVPDLLGDRRLRQRLAELDLDVRTAVFRDSRGLLRIEAEGSHCSALSRPTRLQDLSSLLGVPLRVLREEAGFLSLIQQEPLMAVAGVAAQKKGGESVSGDAGTYFKREDGMLFVLLCDGMGSGPLANRESSLAVRLMEQFLQAGMTPRQALSTLSSALALRGEDNGGFTTVDLLQIDLFTGEGELFKLGAAPTYLKLHQELKILAGAALPAGLDGGEAFLPDHFSFSLAPGDTVVLVSDGVCGTGEDRWLREALTGFSGASPKELARELLTRSPLGATDDRTALVIRLETRK